MEKYELRHRHMDETTGNIDPAPATSASGGQLSEPEETVEECEADPTATSSLPQATDEVPIIGESINSLNLSPRWRNWVVRGIFTWIMIFGFSFIIYLGPLAIFLLITVIQILCYSEIITIGYTVYKSYDLPWFRVLSAYFLFASDYYFYGASLISCFSVLLAKKEFLQFFVTYHTLISFALYCAGFVAFVLSLVKRHYLRQFTLFGWTHVTLLLVVSAAYMLIQNMFQGVIWFVVPISMVIINDIGAYIFGFFMGRTPLIKLSPKKTWEGFIGGAFVTIILGVLMSYVLVHSNHFICPIEYSEVTENLSMDCDPHPVFKIVQYSLPGPIQSIFSLLRMPSVKIKIYPFVLHSIFMSMFASIIGPFGGFFASGFKRAFKIKDFGDTIPGHGGIMDRFDCQFLMAAFIHVYLATFVRVPSPQKLFQQIMLLSADEQLDLFSKLQSTLTSKGLL